MTAARVAKQSLALLAIMTMAACRPDAPAGMNDADL